MNYEIPTEEIENIRKSSNGIILLDYQKDILFLYNDSTTIYRPQLAQMYVKWFLIRNDKTLVIESFYGELNSKENFIIILEILKSITLLKGGNRLGGNIISNSLKKILPHLGFIQEVENNFYLYKHKF